MVPVAASSTLSPSTSPVMVAVPSVRAVPSYAFLAEPVAIVTALGVTVRVPDATVTFVKLAVTSFDPTRNL